jgi:hypothetical protein
MQFLSVFGREKTKSETVYDSSGVVSNLGEQQHNCPYGTPSLWGTFHIFGLRKLVISVKVSAVHNSVVPRMDDISRTLAYCGRVSGRSMCLHIYCWEISDNSPCTMLNNSYLTSPGLLVVRDKKKRVQLENSEL